LLGKRATAIEHEGKSARAVFQDVIKAERMNCIFRVLGLFKGRLGYDQYDKMARSAEEQAKPLGVESNSVPWAAQYGQIGIDFYRGGTVRMNIGGLHRAKFQAQIRPVALAAGLKIHVTLPLTSSTRDGVAFRASTVGGTVQAHDVLV
jgi:hypothetical protein